MQLSQHTHGPMFVSAGFEIIKTKEYLKHTIIRDVPMSPNLAQNEMRS